MEHHFVAADVDSVAVVQVNCFDSLAIDEGTFLDGDVSDHVIGAASLDHRVTLLYPGVAKQADWIFLGATNSRARSFDSILTSAQPALLDCDPRGFSQLLYQPDEQSDRETGDRFAKEPRR